MDVRLSTEQCELRDQAARISGRLGPSTVASLGDSERSAKLDAALAQAGWRELRVPVERGAPSATAVAVGIVAEQLARGLADTAFLGPTLAAELRRLAGAPEATSTETVALRPDLSGPALAGEPAVALDAFCDSSALVLVPSEGNWTLGSVAIGGRGGGVDLTRPASPIAPGAASRVPGQTKPISSCGMRQWTALGLATSCADLVGTMQGALDTSVEYARNRRQYARPIGSFQAVQHLLADVAVALEGSRSTALHAAWSVDAVEPGDALAFTAAAKAYCSRAAVAACETAIQVHGGIGNTWECVAHLYLRRALLSRDVLGGVGPSLRRVLEHAGVPSARGEGARGEGARGEGARGEGGDGLR